MIPSTSAAEPDRPMGIRLTIAECASASWVSVETSGVSVYAGITVFTRMPSRA